jgi:hypothetical protein
MSDHSDQLAAQGLTVQFIQKNLTVNAQLIAAVAPDQRQAMFDQFVQKLTAVGVLTQAEVTRINAAMMARRNGGPIPARGPGSGAGIPGFPGIAQLLEQSAAGPLTDSVLDDLYTGLCTALGGLIGEALGGPGGAAIGAYLMHQWAEANPPSSW